MKPIFIAGSRARADAKAFSSEPSCVTGGRPRYGASICATWSLRQCAITRSAHVLTMPVAPTTIAQVSVTMPSRLCRSSHFTRAERSRRTSPKRSLRMNGA
jgi:hypothetical protein